MAEPVVDETFDLLAKKPGGEYKRLQVKTCRVRPDRNAVVVDAKKQNGGNYTTEDCDFLIGVVNGVAYMFPCTGQREYWAVIDQQRLKWAELKVVKEVN